MSDTALATRGYDSLAPLTSSDVVAQVNLIQEIMAKAMKEGTHFGAIPGCGDKPTLLQAGAQKIALTFRLSPKYIVEERDLPGSHREYEITCELYARDGSFIGQGIGNACTMESRYRFRTQSTGEEVPKEYWKHRDPELLGGKQFSAKKVDGKWMIMEKIEHDNPADYYNTVKKIAAKRAYVSAIRDNTACADIFSDVEDMKANGLAPEEEAPQERAPVQMPQEHKPVSTAGDVVTGVIDDVKQTTTSKGGTRYGICIGKDIYGTFDDKIGSQAEALKGQEVKLRFVKNGRWLNTVEIWVERDAQPNEDMRAITLVDEIYELMFNMSKEQIATVLDEAGIADHEAWEIESVSKLEEIKALAKAL